jgi:hypothetical protein
VWETVAATDGADLSRWRALCGAALVGPVLRLRSIALRSTGRREAIQRPKNYRGAAPLDAIAARYPLASTTVCARLNALPLNGLVHERRDRLACLDDIGG